MTSDPAFDTLKVLLGPLLGFLFTLGTVLFVAFFAHKTERPEIVKTWIDLPPEGASMDSPPQG